MALLRPHGAPLPSPVLDARSLRVLAVLLIVAQLPQVLRLPWWLSIAGVGLVVARLVLIRRGRAAAPSLWLIPAVVAGAAAIRLHYGYFFGRDPGVALLFLMAGLKFMETRTERDGTLVICLAAFLALTQFLYAQSPLSFVMLVATVMMLAFALHAISGTWMVVDNSASRLESMRPLIRLTTTMLLQSVPLAILLFLVFPRLTQPLWGMPADTSSKTGLSDQMEPGMISELSLSDDIAFHVDFTDPAKIPPNALRYWRGPVLTSFDGRTWRAAPRPGLGALPQPAPGTTPSFVDYVVTLEAHHQRWLFALDLPSSMPQDPNDVTGTPLPNIIVTRELQLLSLPLVNSRMVYRQTSMLADRHQGAEPSELIRALRLPGDANPRTRAFALAEREKAASDLEYARAMLRRFNRERFGYTLSPPEVGPDAVDDFLFETQRGFCEHYSGAFAFLLRAAGIPANVVTGYMGGEINPASGSMIVRQSDAHAWVEAWVDGGWRRFDPTAAVAPERVEQGLSAALPAGERIPLFSRPEFSWLREIDWRVDAVNHNWQKWVIGFNADRQKSMYSEIGWHAPKPWQIAVMIGGGLGAWGLAYLLWTRWSGRPRPRDPLDKLWLAINRQLARKGVPRRQSEGPLAYADRLANLWPQHAGLWRECARAYADVRYGQADPGAGVQRLRAVRAQIRQLSLERQR
jgi:transglutaminase-like putative cysteine protease